MLYACGSNGQGQLGLDHQEDTGDWTLVPLNLNGKLEVAGGGNHTVVIEIDTGKAFISCENKFVEVLHPHWGSWKLVSAAWDLFLLVDKNDGIWYGEVNNRELKPIVFNKTLSIVKIESGLSHTVFQTANGELYGFGSSRKGQAGQEQAIIKEPVRFNIDQPVFDFSCGKDFTAVVLQTGKLQVYGNKKWFFDLDKLPPVKTRVSCGWSTLALFRVGIFGNNSHGQLDMKHEYDDFVLGSEHGILVKDNIVETWGWGEHGNCPEPKYFNGNVEIFAGCATSFVNIY